MKPPPKKKSSRGEKFCNEIIEAASGKFSILLEGVCPREREGESAAVHGAEI